MPPRAAIGPCTKMPAGPKFMSVKSCGVTAKRVRGSSASDQSGRWRQAAGRAALARRKAVHFNELRHHRCMLPPRAPLNVATSPLYRNAEGEADSGVALWLL